MKVNEFISVHIKESSISVLRQRADLLQANVVDISTDIPILLSIVYILFICFVFCGAGIVLKLFLTSFHRVGTLNLVTNTTNV